MINVVIPMAGLGSRFSNAGYPDPKPLIPVNGTPMICHVLDNLSAPINLRFIIICQEKDLEAYPDIRARLEEYSAKLRIITIDGLTEGAACTVLAAKSLIDNDSPCVIANCDQHVSADLLPFYQALTSADGLIMTFTADDPKWSFVRRDAEGKITEVVEKEVVSNEATVGIYGFRHGADFCAAALKMIEDDERVNGEFYVAPAYNKMIAAGHTIATHFLDDSKGEQMWGLGTPADLDEFHKHHK